MLRPLLLNQSVDLIFDDTSELPILYSDEGKISQILRNFISNALKFTEKGEIRVGAELVGEDEVRFLVSDTGIGIAPQDIDLIFKDFVQIEHPLQRRVKGTGLGLPLSNKLAVFLGGSVGVKSKVGEGSTFSLRLPRRYSDPAGHEPEAVVELVPNPDEIPVLFVEDSQEMIMVYRSFLKDSGFQLLPESRNRVHHHRSYFGVQRTGSAPGTWAGCGSRRLYRGADRSRSPGRHH
jgi:hypothetical protein